MPSTRCRVEFRNCRSDREELFGRIDMKLFDHLAIVSRYTLSCCGGYVKGRDQRPRLIEFGRARREFLVCNRDLPRMNERLAIIAEIARLPALRSKAGVVGEIAVDRV